MVKVHLCDYFKKSDIRLLTDKRSNATLELVNKKGIRACVFDEDTTDEINIGAIKSLICRDNYYRVFSEKSVKQRSVPFVICNKLPVIRSDDDVWDKLKVISFDRTFVRNFKVTVCTTQLPENHFYTDGNISDIFSKWAQPFMYMLLEAHKEYMVHGLQEPTSVTQYIESYRQKCDIYKDFICDCLEKTDNPKDTISVMELHDLMKLWHKSNYDGKCPNVKELRNYLEKKKDFYTKRSDLLHSHRIEESVKEVIEKSDEKIITNIPINSNNEIESLVNSMRLNKISTIQIIDGKTIVTYDI